MGQASTAFKAWKGQLPNCPRVYFAPLPLCHQASLGPWLFQGTCPLTSSPFSASSSLRAVGKLFVLSLATPWTP